MHLINKDRTDMKYSLEFGLKWRVALSGSMKFNNKQH